ncbi:MAG TPA: alpha/beta hydrolase [Burkholderiales bacterium]|nr:alpha/beta hydrolase [Burkholderiales bacterium]
MKRWLPDRLLPGFETLELAFPDDYDGAVLATLVRLPTANAERGAVLYVHGFSEYFFQGHMAERFAAEGYAFYALDLRKHGRSLRPHQHPNFCKSLTEYYADISGALEVIGGPVLLAGHSTGGLICSLYAHEGAHRSQVQALWLNSPFFDWNVPDWRKVQLYLAVAAGRYCPFLNDPKAFNPDYTRALRAEWEFDSALKPDYGFPLYYGWLGAITDGFAKVHSGLAIECPVLAMHSDEADVVLNWRHIARWSRGLGRNVTVLSFPGGWHDLICSPGRIREEVFSALFAWVERAVALPA